MASVQDKLKASILDVQKSFVILAEVRQTLVTTAISLRDTGNVADVRRVNEFEASRRLMMNAAYLLDRSLDALEKEDPAAWTQMIGAFNKYAQNIPGVNISSISIAELIGLAVPAFPRKILEPVDNADIRKAVDTERRFYGMRTQQLGFLPALAPLISVCSTAIAATAAATAGVGGIAVAIGCGLGALAIVAGTIYVSAKAAQTLLAAVDALNPAAATSRAEAERLKELANAYKAVDEVTKGLTPEEKKQVLKDFRDKGLPQPETPTNWTLVAGLAVAAFGIFAIYVMPRMPKREVSVAGLRRRSRRR